MSSCMFLCDSYAGHLFFSRIPKRLTSPRYSKLRRIAKLITIKYDFDLTQRRNETLPIYPLRFQFKQKFLWEAGNMNLCAGFCRQFVVCDLHCELLTVWVLTLMEGSLVSSNGCVFVTQSPQYWLRNSANLATGSCFWYFPIHGNKWAWYFSSCSYVPLRLIMWVFFCQPQCR